MTLTPLDIVLLLVALAAVGFALWRSQQGGPILVRLTAERDERVREADGLRAERDAQRQRADVAEKALAAGQAQIAEREKSFVRETEQMSKLQAEGETRFQALADAALLKSQQQFIQIADETLKKHKEGAQGELGKMLQPIQETFGQFKEKVAEIEKVRSEDRAKLDEQIRAMGSTMQETQQATTRLAGALSTTRHGGRWGEETLRNVLEMAGLSPYADFTEQTSTTSVDKGRQRPDVIIRMPGGRELVIDSKVSLDDYLAASNETDPARRRDHLSAHAARVRAHVASLAKKEYWKEISDRVDFVAMFIPGENFYAAVLEHDRDIFDYASRNNVIIVTPSTLIALAKSVAYGWRQEQMAKNAEQAAKLGQDLHDRLLKMCEHIDKVGGGLGNATRAYNDLVGSFEARVMPAARKFEELSLTRDAKPIEAPKQVDTAPRQLTLLDGMGGAEAAKLAAPPAAGRRKADG
ncbi:MAG: DNA recombination protein RmuC [Alphaproteobacteria bacterium]